MLRNSARPCIDTSTPMNQKISPSIVSMAASPHQTDRSLSVCVRARAIRIAPAPCQSNRQLHHLIDLRPAHRAVQRLALLSHDGSLERKDSVVVLLVMLCESKSVRFRSRERGGGRKRQREGERERQTCAIAGAVSVPLLLLLPARSEKPRCSACVCSAGCRSVAVVMSVDWYLHSQNSTGSQ